VATAPHFVLGPSTFLSLLGLIHGPDRTPPTPIGDWRKAVVDVVIPALNEERYIVLCLDSISKQTLQPRYVLLVDDGSRDHTVEYAKNYAGSVGLQLLPVFHDHCIGRTSSLKAGARELNADVEFVLDGDTELESENYIERCVEELYIAAGVASVCGTIMPLRERDRRRLLASAKVQRVLEQHPDYHFAKPAGLLHRLSSSITNNYRTVLYTFLQRFIHKGQMNLYGSITHPLGCAVAYRRDRLKVLLDHYEPILGDNLTSSEDIFIGFSLVEQGFRNVQLPDVYARSLEPEFHHLPAQLKLWSSSLLQSCYYFNDLVRSPFLSLRRWQNRRRFDEVSKSHRAKRVSEPYREVFGKEITQRQGRPMGWVVFMSAFEKVCFPVTILIMLTLGYWELLGFVLLVESVFALSILTWVSRGKRLEMLWRGILATPVRYGALLYELVAITRFGWDLWVSGHREWRR